MLTDDCKENPVYCLGQPATSCESLLSRQPLDHHNLTRLPLRRTAPEQRGQRTSLARVDQHACRGARFVPDRQIVRQRGEIFVDAFTRYVSKDLGFVLQAIMILFVACFQRYARR